MFFMVHHNVPAESQRYLDMLSENFKNTNIFLTGNKKLIEQLQPGKKMKWVQSVDELEKAIGE